MQQIYRFLLIGLTILITLPSYANSPKQFDKLVVFGDSLSDSGNMYNAMEFVQKNFINTGMCSTLQKLIPSVDCENFFLFPVQPYINGRFNNGEVWVEYLAHGLNLDTNNKAEYANFAFGGAWVESNKYSKQVFPLDLASEVSYYLLKGDRHKAKHLYIIWDGNNDYLDGREDVDATTTRIVDIVHKQIARLVKAGGRQFLVPNLPDFGMTPYATNVRPDIRDNLHQLAVQHNTKLENALAQLEQQYQAKYPDFKIYRLDIQGELGKVINNPNDYGFTNVTEACYPGSPVNPGPEVQNAMKTYAQINITNPVFAIARANTHWPTACTNTDEYFFFDALHPTEQGARILASRALMVLGEVSEAQ